MDDALMRKDVGSPPSGSGSAGQAAPRRQAGDAAWARKPNSRCPALSGRVPHVARNETDSAAL